MKNITKKASEANRKGNIMKYCIALMILTLAASAQAGETFAVGIHGFYLKQITGDSGGGTLLGDFKAEAAGVGPALLWTTRIGNQDVSFIAKWLQEFNAEKRLEGDHIFLSFALGW